MDADYGNKKTIKNSDVKVDTVLARELLILKSQNEMAYILLEDEPIDSLYSDKPSLH